MEEAAGPQEVEVVAAAEEGGRLGAAAGVEEVGLQEVAVTEVLIPILLFTKATDDLPRAIIIIH